MAFPTPKVYIAFTDGPYVASPTWTEVTDYVFSADVSRGRADDFSNVVGTAYVVLNNNTRRFDPFNTAGPYYNNLLPRRQIKIEAVSGSTTFPVFRGYIAGWPAQFDNAGKTGTVSLQCFDALALLAQEQLPDYVYAYTQTLTPTHYYRLDDPIGQGFLKDVGSSPTNLVATGNTYNKSSSIVPALQSEATQFPAFYQATGIASVANTAISISFWIESATLKGTNFTGTTFGTSQVQITFAVPPANGGQYLIYGINTALGNTYFAQPTVPLGTDQSNGPVHIVATFTGSTLKIYVNGQDATPALSTLPGGSATNALQVFGPLVQELSTYNYVLNATQVADLYKFTAASLTETTSARFNRLLAYTSMPSALYSASASPVASVAAIGQVASNLTAELSLVNNSEGGVMYVSKSGVLTFQDRNYYYTNTKSTVNQATLATGSIGYEPQVSMEYSGDDIRNVYQVNYTGGGFVEASDASSVSAYGRNTTTLDTQLSTVAQANTLAAYEAFTGGTLLSDISPVKVGVAGVTADWTTLLGLELFERYTITVNPSTGSAFSQTQLINQIKHTIVPGKYEMTIDGSARFSSRFILDQSVLDGQDRLQ